MSETTWDESGVTDEELDGWPEEARELWSTFHAALDRLDDARERGDDKPPMGTYRDLEFAYDAVAAVCRLRAEFLRLRAKDEAANLSLKANAPVSPSQEAGTP